MIDLLPSLGRHLQPPQVCAPFSLVRFSPLFESFRKLRSRNVQPSAAYRLTYRVPDDLLWGLATAFDYDEALPLRTRAYRYRLRAEVRTWQRGSGAGKCSLEQRKDGRLVLTDGRQGRPATRELDDLEALVLLQGREAMSLSQLVAAARQDLPPGQDLEADMADRLARLLAERVMVRVGERYLSLVAPEGAQPVTVGRREAARS